MSLQELSNYTFQSRYSQYNYTAGRKETWEEAVERIFLMHREKYSKQLSESDDLKEAVDFAEEQYKKKRTLGSQRALQFGGDPILKSNARLYNCTGTVIDRAKAFQDIVYVLMCGCGAGYSVQQHHINKLPTIKRRSNTEVVYVIPDTCEGWADAVGVLLSSYFVGGGEFPEFENKTVIFDGSQIRPKGSLIAGRFKAPGPEPLLKGLKEIENLIENLLDKNIDKLRPIDAHDIICYAANFVISAGVRRSALISLFDAEDKLMSECKVGNWFIKNPQRARANNSAIIIRDKIQYEDFKSIVQNIKEYGEPGFYFVDNPEYVSTNPCCEIGFWPINKDGNTGVSFCNLTEINGGYCNTKEKFFEQCKASAIIGTLQAGYTDFPYLGKTTEEIVRSESLLGCSITGWMTYPDVFFDPDVLEHGVGIIKEWNEKIANIIGINPAARLTCSKPAGSTSALLGTCSGIHPHHAKKYIRAVQSNEQDSALNYFESINPQAVEKSVWNTNGTDKVIYFLCDVEKGSILKNQISAIEFLEKIKLAQKHWVIPGTISERSLNPNITHNISNTCVVKDNEWEEVTQYIYNNRDYFSGISLLPASGDLDYSQAPFSTVLTPNELIKEYGGAAVFASGLIVDGLDAFNNNLWAACDSALGIGEELAKNLPEPQYPTTRNYKDLANYFEEKDIYDTWFKKTDWIRRLKQFAERYFGGDVRRATYCCKHVALWKKWVDLKREYKEVNWTQIYSAPEYVDANTLAAQACSGGQCEINI